MNVIHSFASTALFPAQSKQPPLLQCTVCALYLPRMSCPNPSSSLALEDEQQDEIVAPNASIGKWGASAPAPAKKKQKIKGKDAFGDDASGSKAASYVYGADDNASVLAELDADMKDVAKKCPGYPKKIPACLANLDVNRILAGALLGRSISKAELIMPFFSQKFLSHAS